MLTFSYLLISSYVTGSQLRAVLEDKAADVDASSSDFWIMVAALKVCPDCPYPKSIIWYKENL